MKNTSDKDLYTLSELCEKLSVSAATGNNWVKLKKIIPTKLSKNIPLFSNDYLEELKEKIKNDKKILKSRRNKNFVSGNKFYNYYNSNRTENTAIIKEFIKNLEKTGLKITDNVISQIVAHCAIQLILSYKNSLKNNDNFSEISVKKFLSGSIDLSEYKFLVDDFLENTFEEPILDLNELKLKYTENEDTLGLIYLSLRSLNERKSSGAYYTPTYITENFCKNLFKTGYKNKTILDPCCGSGNFLIQLPKDTEFKNIYGNDIDIFCVKIARFNIALKYGITDKNALYKHITNNDYLSAKSEQKYDYIIGNPPWGANCSDNKNNKTDSYNLITEKALTQLKKDGILGFIIPESFLNVKIHAKTRKKITENNSIKYIEYLGNIFDDVHCPCIIIHILHNNKPFDTKGLIVKKDSETFTINTSRNVNPDYFNFLTNDTEYDLIKKIDNIPNKITLKNNSKFALGIVTGDNKKYLSSKKTKSNEPVIKGSDLEMFKYKISSYITFKPANFQQTAPTDLYRTKEKLFYKFISKKLVFAYDDKQLLSLNSCNILIPKADGLNIKYILAILNSEIVQFYFKKVFNSVKILRSHIEEIPIPFVDNKIQKEVIKLTEKIIISDETEYKELYKKLNILIAKLYKINDKEYEIIKSSGV